MSDFKRKIEIVESTTPPPNKYNWWFDPNTDELKRYKNGNWELYNYNWPTTSLPPTNEIWLDLDSLYASEKTITTAFEKIGTIKKVEIITPEEESDSALVKIIFEQNLTDITVANSISLSSITESHTTIIFPNLGSLNYTGSGTLFTGNDDMFSVDFIFGEIKSISGCLLYTMDRDAYISIYSKDVPTIQSKLIDVGRGEIYVYVPNRLLKEYKSSTNWALYNITSID